MTTNIETAQTLSPTLVLQTIRDNADMAGWATVGDGHNKRLRIASRIYDLDAGYAGGGIWVNVSFRRAGKPNITVLGQWTLNNAQSVQVLELLGEVADTVNQSERRILGVSGEETEEY